jgi:hypothetical protein
MKAFFCTALLIITTVFIVTGQPVNRIIRGRVTDINGNGLSYVNAGIINTTYGTVTGMDGNFSIYFEDAVLHPGDSLRFSMIGFQPFAMALGSIPSDDRQLSVTLQSAEYRLEEVIIAEAGLIEVVEGNDNITTTMSNNMAISGLPGQNLGAEVGRKFHFKGKMHHLRKLNFYIRYCNFDTVVFRVNIYQIEDGKPGRLLINDNILFSLYNHRKGWVSFDLAPYRLAFDSNVIIALQWVGQSQKGTLLGFPITVPSPGAVHFYKFGSESRWKKFISMSTAMNVEALREP